MRQTNEAERLPELAPGMEVCGYRVKARLGAGGYGEVFLAEQGGHLVALKRVPMANLSEWGTREILMLSRVNHPNAARMLGHFYFPLEAPRCLVIVMQYVEGQQLDVWTAVENPSAREVARRVLGVARALVALHSARAFHRDVKEANIIVRASDGEAVLVDFGVGTAEDTAPRTRGALAPGTPNYLCPEAWRFERESQGKPGARFIATPAADFYALGVTLYRLLTAALPFDTRTEGGVEDVLDKAPRPPHVRNPRVPLELSELCLQLLAKSPEERPEGGALCTALGELLTREGADWSAPLCEFFTLENLTTEQGPDADEEDAWVNRNRMALAVPRRGRRPFQPVAPASSAEDAPAALVPSEPVVPPGQADAPPALAPPAPAPRAGQAAPLTPAPALAPSAPPHRGRARAALGLGLALAVCAAGAAWVLVWRGPAAEPPRAPAVGTPAAHDRAGEQAASSSGQGGKVAPGGEAPEAQRVAVPPQAAPTPAATASPAVRVKEAPSVKMQKTPSPPQQPATGPGALTRALGVAAICTLATGCPSPGPQAQVRPTPAPAPCPPGALEAMQELGIKPGQEVLANLLVDADSQLTVVREGPVTAQQLGALGGLPGADTQLLGRVIIGQDRAYVRLTRARTLDGTVDVPVCIEAWDESRVRGLIRRKQQPSEADAARVVSGFTARAVGEFQ